MRARSSNLPEKPCPRRRHRAQARMMDGGRCSTRLHHRHQTQGPREAYRITINCRCHRRAKHDPHHRVPPQLITINTIQKYVTIDNTGNIAVQKPQQQPPGGQSAPTSSRKKGLPANTHANPPPPGTLAAHVEEEEEEGEDGHGPVAPCEVRRVCVLREGEEDREEHEHVLRHHRREAEEGADRQWGVVLQKRAHTQRTGTDTHKNRKKRGRRRGGGGEDTKDKELHSAGVVVVVVLSCCCLLFHV